MLVTGLLESKVRPHPVERGENLLRFPDQERVSEVRYEVAVHETGGVIRHILEKDRLLVYLR